MTAYEIIQQHPEWATSERVPTAAIQERAKRYVSDYKGNGNFAKGVTEDLADLLRRRDATNDFACIVADGDTPQVNTESPKYLADKRKSKSQGVEANCRNKSRKDIYEPKELGVYRLWRRYIFVALWREKAQERNASPGNCRMEERPTICFCVLLQ